MVQQIVDTLATAAARIEESAYPHAVILPDFPRSIQLDGYSCGAKSVYTILKYFGKRCTPQGVERALHTDEYGTAVWDIKRVLKKLGLKSRTLRKPGLRDLKAAIVAGCPVLITTWQAEHYSVVYGYSDSKIFIANPSIDVSGVGRLSCAVPKAEFRRAWDRYGIVVKAAR